MVAMDANGEAVIVWNQATSTEPQIFLSEYRDGIWAYPADLSDYISPAGQNAEAPQVAMDDLGNAIIIWRQGDTVTDRIFKSEYRNGVWTHPANISEYITPDGDSADYPHVAMDNNGNAIIVWAQDNGKALLYKSEYRDGSWTHPEDINDYIGPDGENVSQPFVVMSDNGDAVIVWRQSDGVNPQAFMSEFR
jgi:uncharacterized protein YheU (UPF0270 family)